MKFALSPRALFFWAMLTLLLVVAIKRPDENRPALQAPPPIPTVQAAEGSAPLAALPVDPVRVETPVVPRANGPAREFAGDKVTHQLMGRVELLDGEPLPAVVVTATQVMPEGSFHQEVHSLVSDAEGTFQFLEVDPGEYTIQVFPNYDNSLEVILPVRGGPNFATGPEPVVVAVDALLVRTLVRPLPNAQNLPGTVSCTESRADGFVDIGWGPTTRPIEHSAEGADAAKEMKRFNQDLFHANLADGPGPSPLRGQWTCQAEFLLPTTNSFRFQTAGTPFLHSDKAPLAPAYYALLPAGIPSGKVDLELSQNPTTLGTIELQLSHPSIPDGARLGIIAIRHNEVPYMANNFKSKPTAFGLTRLSMEGLVPGDYYLHLQLHDAGLVRLKETSIRLDVVGGATSFHELATAECGTLRVSARAPHAPKATQFANLECMRPGETPWRPLSLTTRERYPGGSRIHQKSAVLLDGEAGVSSPLFPGEYKLRLTPPSQAPLIQTIVLGSGEEKHVRFHIQGL